ncbi:MAG: prolyl oligopeptidase family serine peptidase [Myxococcota bacterium]
MGLRLSTVFAVVSAGAVASCTPAQPSTPQACADDEAAARTYDAPEVMTESPPLSAPPMARRDDTTDTLHGVVVADPYRWLEDETDPEVAAWTAGNDAWARERLAKLPGRDALAERLAELMYVDQKGAPRVRGGKFFFTKKAARDEKWTYLVQDGPDAPERILLDPKKFPDDGSITGHGVGPSPDGRYWVYKVSRNNADAATMFIKDVATGEDLSPHDVIDGARYASPSWLPDGSGFYYTGLPDDADIPPAELPGHAAVKFHRIGTSADEDVTVYPALMDPTTFIGAGVSRDGQWLVLTISRGFDSNDVYVADLRGKKGPGSKDDFVPAVVGRKHHYSTGVHEGRLIIDTDDGADRSRVMVADPAKPGREHWTELVPEHAEGGTLEGSQVIGGRLVLSYLVNAHSMLAVHELDGSFVRTIALPGLGSSGGLAGHPEQDTAYLGFTSYTEPHRIYSTSIKDGGLTLWHAPDVPVDASRFETEQVWVTSKDGTKVSAFIVRNKGIALDGSHPVMLYGYGGFNVSLTPSFSASATTWLEGGGVYVVPNLRGGGEYGEPWHQAGKGPRKQNTFDDFIATARWLIEHGYTKPGRIAIQGGSNGGLLVGATATQAPELFGAVLCGVPLLDMIRYHKFGSGPTWISEYGSADDPEQFATLWAYSPYHRIDGQTLPPLLMLASDHDDRVDPLHARKFVAAAQHTGTDAWLRVEKNAGHGGSDLVRASVQRAADSVAFARWALSKSP